MTSEHELWLAQAAEFARTKRHDEARQIALRVLRADGRNTKALWIVACSTDSLIERRNALNALLRVAPNDAAARQMLNDTEQELRVQSNPAPRISENNRRSSSVIRSIGTSKSG